MSDAAKLEMMLPLIREVVEGNVATATKGLRANDEREQYLELLFASYDRSCRTAVEEATTAPGLFTSRLSRARTADDLCRRLPFARSTRPAFSSPCPHHAQGGLPAPGQHRRRPLAACFARSGFCAARARSRLSILIAVLSELREAITSKALSGPEAKRARTSLGSDETMKRICAILVAVLESAVGSRLLCSGALLYELFEVLRVAVDLHSGLLATNAEQMMQLAMSCIEKLVGVLPKSAAAIPAEVAQALRADTIVSAIKSSNNPQTFQHALLLLSKIAIIAPEAVLHNVMPSLRLSVRPCCSATTHSASPSSRRFCTASSPPWWARSSRAMLPRRASSR